MSERQPGDEAFTSSPFVAAVEPIDASDDEIRAFLADAEIPPLLPAIAYATGDMTLLKPELRPDPMLVGMPQGGLSEEQQAQARELALGALVAFRDAGCRPAPPPADDQLLEIMRYAVGGAEMADYLPLLEEELAYRGEDRRAPGWKSEEVAPGVDFVVLIVGAGMSGLLAGHRLQQAGVPFVILEKNDDVGGTWLENTYPGCRVDNPNHNYSYAFAQRHDWPFHFSTQDVLLDYFRRCAETFQLREHIRFATEVVAADWSDDASAWSVRVRDREGDEATITVNAVVSAVGQLNRPSFPDIAGRDSYAGVSFHSARWDHDIDLAGKRVAVIGTGASAVQFIPEVAPTVGELLVFQRTPPWFGSDPRLPRPRVAGPPMAVRARAFLQRMEPVLDLLAHGRRRARRRARGPRLGTEGRGGERGERSRAHGAHRLPRHGVRRPARSARARGAGVPTRRQAPAARQRRLGAHDEARQRAVGDRRRSARSHRTAS